MKSEVFFGWMIVLIILLSFTLATVESTSIRFIAGISAAVALWYMLDRFQAWRSYKVTKKNGVYTTPTSFGLSSEDISSIPPPMLDDLPADKIDYDDSSNSDDE
jgi:hypothetical protein